MKLQDLIEKFKRFPVPSICGGIILVCFLAFYLRMELISDLEIRQDEASRQANQVDTNIVAGASLEDHVAQMRAKVGELNERVVRPLELATNHKYFYSIESETGVRLADLRQNPPAPPAKGTVKPTFIGVGYNVVLSGTFAQAVAYLSELENGPRLYHLKSFDLQRGREANQPTVTLALNLELLGLP